MFGYRLLALGSWCSFFTLFWLLLLGEIDPTLGSLAALVFFGLSGLAATGSMAAEYRHTAAVKKEEKSDD